MYCLAPITAITAATIALLASSTTAQSFYRQDFETLTASAVGTPLTGQDGYYIPAGTTSIDMLTHTYAGNPYGAPANPSGGNNFIGGTGPAGTVYCRAERAFPWTLSEYTIGFDVLTHFSGTLPTAQNCGSVSLQPTGSSAYMIALARWTDINTAANWNADFVYFDSAGLSVTGSVPDPAFQNLAIDQWYRWEVDLDLAANTVLEIRLYDPTAGTVATHVPTGWYLTGGSAGGFPVATAFRFFAGGGVAGNVLAFDNLSIGPRATFSTYGAGCAGSNGTPTLDAAPGARPRIGTTFDMALNNLPVAGSAVVGVVGFSDTFWSGVPLPFDLGPLGMTGCSLLADLSFALTQVAGGASATWGLPVPMDVRLLGGDIYVQALVVDPGVNPFGMTATNGGSLHIGG